jgi:hypothetical protein
MCSYVRLELLEGVVAFHSGEAAAAASRLAAAQARWQRLQVRHTGKTSCHMFAWHCIMRALSLASLTF